jgi:hypothetical protein
MKTMPRTWDETANNELENLDSAGGVEDSRQMLNRITKPLLPERPLSMTGS